MAAREGKLESVSCFQLASDLGQIGTRICADAAHQPDLVGAAFGCDVTSEFHPRRPAARSAAPTLAQQCSGLGQRGSR
jgi:hypothetical protein